MSSHKLTLNVGDRVRNINEVSKRKGLIGIVTNFGGNTFLDKPTYEVEWYNGGTQSYLQCNAHRFLEKIGETSPACCCTHECNTARHVLKRVRRNVITGKTQDDFVRELGHARGVEQFNTRALGTTTGQAFRVIGDAMCNPGTEIRISKVDHAKGNELCSTSWTTLDKHFRHVVQELIGERKGFTFTPTHIIFNPIVTEETYVTRSH